MKKLKHLVAAIMLLSLLVVTAVSVVLLNPAWLFRTSSGHAGEFGVEEAFSSDRLNIALLGFDRSAERDQFFSIYRPDTILIASFDFKSRNVSLVNISRDSYVAIAGTEIYDKINHAYMYGHNLPDADNPHQSGINTTIETIEDFLGGVTIHHYVILDMDGVVEIVDQIGGINYEVEYPVRADFGRGELLLEQGSQRLNGRQLLTYVRDRSVEGDVGRSRRQQQILIATFAQLKRQGRLKDIPAIYSALVNNVETSLSTAQIASLALFATRVDPQQILTHVFPGSIQFAPLGELDISYIVIDELARVQMIEDVFGVSVEQREQITLPGLRKPALLAKMEQQVEQPPRETIRPPAESLPEEGDNQLQPSLPAEEQNSGQPKEE